MANKQTKQVAMVKRPENPVDFAFFNVIYTRSGGKVRFSYQLRKSSSQESRQMLRSPPKRCPALHPHIFGTGNFFTNHLGRENMRSLTKCLLLTLLLMTPGLFACAQGTGSADKPADPSAVATRQEVQQLRQEIAAQRQTIEELKTMVQQLAATKSPNNTAEHARMVDAVLAQPGTAGAPASDQKPDEKKESSAIQRVTGPELKFSVGGGEVQVYGHADVSLDYVDNGLANRFGAVGNNGWLAQVSSNLSYFGVRGSRRLVPHLNGVFQIETEVAFSSTPGPTTDAQVKQGLGSRDTYVGVQGSWGANQVRQGRRSLQTIGDAPGSLHQLDRRQQKHHGQ